MNWIIRIIKSFFALPVWVIVWIAIFLIPANFAGLWFLDTVTGLWIVILGAGAVCINLVLTYINGGMSKVLSIPHLIFWIPLQLLLGYRMIAVPMELYEYHLALAVFVVNGISLFFDVYDTREWWNGNRDVVGYEGEPVKF